MSVYVTTKYKIGSPLFDPSFVQWSIVFELILRSYLMLASNFVEKGVEKVWKVVAVRDQND